MDAEDLARALSAEPPTAAVRADAVQVIARSVASAKRRRARAAVAASIGAVVVVVAVVTGSIATFSGRAAPAPQPAQITTTMNVPTTTMTVPSRSTVNGSPTPTTHPVRVTLQSGIPSRSTASGRPTLTPHPARVTTTRDIPSRSTATVSNAPMATPAATSVGSASTSAQLPTSFDSPPVTFPTAVAPHPPATLITTPQNSTTTKRSNSQRTGAGSAAATSTPTPTAQTASSNATVPQPVAPPRSTAKSSTATAPTRPGAPGSSTGSSASSAPAPTAGSPASLARFVGTYKHHTSYLVIKADHTGIINSNVGCCRGTSDPNADNVTTYPLRFSGGDNNTLQGTVTGPAVISGAGGGVHMKVGQKIEFQFVTGQNNEIIRSSGFPAGYDRAWCATDRNNHDNICGA